MKKKKRSMTLLEVMIVIFIIGIIGSVIGYNMKGSMEKARAFKTREGIKKVTEILTLQLATEATEEQIRDNPLSVLKDSGLATDPKTLFQDGWGKPYEVTIRGDRIRVFSKSYNKYLKKRGEPLQDDKEEEDDGL